MKKNRIFLMVVGLLLVCAIGMNLAGCTVTAQAGDLMEGITPKQVTPLADLHSQNAAVTDFAVRLFRASNDQGKNTLISPLSVLCALSMTANGAEEETLNQMEKVLGMSREELNLYLYTYMQNLPTGEKYKLKLANSIWFTGDSRFSVKQNFLQTNADYYGADVYKALFDEQTCKNINDWVKNKTDGMIPEILDQIPPEAVMYLVNALAFEAEWSKIYEENQVREGEFIKEDGTKQKVEFMYSTEGVYLADEKATGFMKYYSGEKYAFVALLPNKGVSLSDYIASLTGESLHRLLSNPKADKVETAIPKFETGYDVELSAILKAMGMPDAFDDEKANFTGLGTSSAGNIYIGRVLHKTFISVAEKGTKAGAATVVEMWEETSIMPTLSKEVILDRPFVYMLVDCENNIPFFIGTMTDIEK